MNPYQQTQEEIIIFTRYPKPGRVKTRLIPHLGSEGAARLHKHLAELALTRARTAAKLRSASLSLWFADASREQMTDWLGPTLRLQPQQGKDLGQRMALAFRDTWAQGMQRAVLIGSDCPALTTDHIAQALDDLMHNDLVLGPAVDGGYYLIGLHRDLTPEVLAFLFRDIDWGSESVYRQTLARGTEANLTITTLQELNDIDRPEDLQYYDYHPDLQ